MKNHIFTKKVPHSHGGATLIGLMIGLLVSMIGILGSLSLYKTLTQTSVDATFDTKHDGNAAITLTLISSATQNAGFGLLAPDAAAVPPVFPHIIQHAATGSLVWRSANVPDIAVFNPLFPTASGVKCQRVIEEFDNANNTRIVLLESVIDGPNCDSTSDLTALAAAWPVNSTSEIISVTSLSRLKADYAKQANSQRLLSYTLTQDINCSPFNAINQDMPFTNIQLQITHLASVDLNSQRNVDSTAAAGSISHFVCITNPQQ